MTETSLNREFTSDELIAHLVQAEWDDRYNRKLQRLIDNARFRYRASIEEVDFTVKRNLDKNQLIRLSSSDWITKKQNIIIVGSTGSGKSWIASALGHQGCQHGYKVLYKKCIKLFDELKIAKADGSYSREISKLENGSIDPQSFWTQTSGWSSKINAFGNNRRQTREKINHNNISIAGKSMAFLHK